jgi:hypothetical protein
MTTDMSTRRGEQVAEPGGEGVACLVGVPRLVEQVRVHLERCAGVPAADTRASSSFRNSLVSEEMASQPPGEGDDGEGRIGEARAGER